MDLRNPLAPGAGSSTSLSTRNPPSRDHGQPQGDAQRPGAVRQPRQTPRQAATAVKGAGRHGDAG